LPEFVFQLLISSWIIRLTSNNYSDFRFIDFLSEVRERKIEIPKQLASCHKQIPGIKIYLASNQELILGPDGFVLSNMNGNFFILHGPHYWLEGSALTIAKFYSNGCKPSSEDGFKEVYARNFWEDSDITKARRLENLYCILKSLSLSDHNADFYIKEEVFELEIKRSFSDDTLTLVVDQKGVRVNVDNADLANEIFSEIVGFGGYFDLA
jgi:hypothetical protein